MLNISINSSSMKYGCFLDVLCVRQYMHCLGGGGGEGGGLYLVFFLSVFHVKMGDIGDILRIAL